MAVLIARSQSNPMVSTQSSGLMEQYFSDLLPLEFRFGVRKGLE
jgi:hypothetical protein